MSGKKINQLKGGVILSYLSLFLGNGISIIYTPIMLRLLGQSEYGLYNLVSSFVAYLGLLSFGFDNTYLRYYTQYKHKESKEKVASLNGMFLAVFSVMGLVALIVGSILCCFSNEVFGDKLTASELETAKILMFLLVINIAITFPSNVFKIFINANERFVFAKVVNLIKTVVNPFVTIPLLLMGYKSVALVVVTLIYTVVIDVLNLWYCFKKLDMKISFKNFEFKLFKNIAGFSLFVFLGEIVDEINWNVDKFLLGRFRGTVDVAIYGVAASLSSYFRQFSIYISSVFSPRVNKIVATENDNTILTELMIKVGRIQFFVLSLVATGFVFFGESFCVIWAGEDYRSSYLIAAALMVPSIIPLIQNLGISVLLARNKHRFRSVAFFIIALINFLISIPFCKLYGGLGCAIGTGISLVVGNGIIINLYYKKLGLNMAAFWKSILSMTKGSIVPVAIGIVTMVCGFEYNLITLLCCISVYAIIYVLSMYKFGCNDYERNLIFGFIKKIKGKISHANI